MREIEACLLCEILIWKDTLLQALRITALFFPFFHYWQPRPSAQSFPLRVVYECLLPSASRPIKVMDQRVRFRAPVDTDSAVLHLLIAGKEEPGTETSIQSAAMVSNNFFNFFNLQKVIF